MKKVYFSLLAVSIVLLAIISKQDQSTIIVYSSAEQFRNEQMQTNLDEAFPELNIRVMYTPTSKAAAKLSVEKENTDADIVVGLETSYLNKISDSLADAAYLSNLDYVEEFKPENINGNYVIWERQAGAFVINKDVIERDNLPIPKSYTDLLDPVYKGKIAMPDPKSSGTGYFFYKNLVNVLGEDEALDYFDKLEKNIKQFSESGSGPIKLLNQGEVAIGLALTFQAVSEINRGMPFEIIFPAEGSPYSLTGTGLVLGRENDDDIVRVYQYIINDFIMYDKEHFSPEKIVNDQVNTIPNYPQNIHYADMEGIQDIDIKERLLQIWKY